MNSPKFLFSVLLLVAITATLAIPDQCMLPQEIGPCRGRIERYYYDVQSQHCEQFFYGGCKGNSNRFETKAECIKVCGGI